MFAFAVKRRRSIEFVYDTIDPRSDKALTQQALQQLLVFPFAVLDDRCQEQDPSALIEHQDPVYHFAYCAGGQGDSVIRAPRFADPGIKKAQVVIYFGHGADRGSGIMGCRFLLNTDRG